MLLGSLRREFLEDLEGLESSSDGPGFSSLDFFSPPPLFLVLLLLLLLAGFFRIRGIRAKRVIGNDCFVLPGQKWV